MLIFYDDVDHSVRIYCACVFVTAGASGSVSVLALVVPIPIPIVRPANTNLAIFWTCIFAFHAGALWITLFVLELKYIRYFIRIWLRFLNGTYTRRASF